MGIFLTAGVGYANIQNNFGLMPDVYLIRVFITR